jgi:hypothetical protein
MKGKLFRVLAVVLMVALMVVMPLVVSADPGDPVSMVGSYALRGKVNMYGLDGQRVRAGGVLVKCSSLELIILSQVTNELTATLEMPSVFDEDPLPCEGYVGGEGKNVYFVLWGTYESDTLENGVPPVSFTLFGRLSQKDGDITAIRGCRLAGMTDSAYNDDEVIYFNAVMTGKWVELP